MRTLPRDLSFGLRVMVALGAGCGVTVTPTGVDGGGAMQAVDSGHSDPGRPATDAGDSVDEVDGSPKGPDEAGADGAVSSDAQGAFDEAGSPQDAGTEDAQGHAPRCLPPDDGPCAQYPCQNGGSCAEVDDDYVCDCLAGWSGRNCEDLACTEGAIRCNATSRNAEQCLAGGTWHQVDVCSSPDELCRPGLGCVLNEPYEVGRPDVEGWAPWDAENGRAYWYPIEVQRPSRAKYVRLFAASSGGECKVALYEGSGGTPGRVLTVGVSPIYVVADINGVEVVDAAQLAPGRPYWIAVRCHAPHGAVQLLRHQDANARAYQGATACEKTFQDSPLGECVSGVAWPFFLVVQDT